MKAPIKRDIFHNGNYLFKHSRNEDCKVIDGNFYINGDADAERFMDILEVFGDLIIEGTLYICKVIVHGNLICGQIIGGDKIEVDGDVYVSGKLKAKSIICKSGDIFYDETLIDG
ncbi:MAG: hypothetical protein K6B70_01670 [Clostridia bacterium]|nr:hypothetical protein [Clostridia bacterium]